MTQLRIATREWADEAGRLQQVHYYLTIDPVEAGQIFLENYGVCVALEQGEAVAVRGVTTSASRIDELLTLLAEHCVGPAAAADVVSDWL